MSSRITFSWKPTEVKLLKDKILFLINADICSVKVAAVYGNKHFLNLINVEDTDAPCVLVFLLRTPAIDIENNIVPKY